MAKTSMIIIYCLKLDPPAKGEPSNPLRKSITFYNRGRKLLAVEFLTPPTVFMISNYFGIPKAIRCPITIIITFFI